MYKKLRTTVLLAFCLLSAHIATADDAVWGALLGCSAGAAVGSSIIGRNGAVVGGE